MTLAVYALVLAFLDQLPPIEGAADAGNTVVLF